MYRFPTPEPEADGTLQWDATTAVTVTLTGGGRTGLGWTYSSPAAAAGHPRHTWPARSRGRDAFDVAGGWSAMRRACRNLGTRGLVMQAISAVDIAWWDLKARLLDVPLATLLGRCRTAVPIYGSGGFTTLSDTQLAEQVDGLAGGRLHRDEDQDRPNRGAPDIDRDLARVERLRDTAPVAARRADGRRQRRLHASAQARRVGAALDELGRHLVRGTRQQRRHRRRWPPCAPRCAATSPPASTPPTSTTCAPLLPVGRLPATRRHPLRRLHRLAARRRARRRRTTCRSPRTAHRRCTRSWPPPIPNLRHVEWFVDHARLEPLLVDGLPDVRDGALHPDHTARGHGMTISRQAERWCT